MILSLYILTFWAPNECPMILLLLISFSAKMYQYSFLHSPLLAWCTRSVGGVP